MASNSTEESAASPPAPSEKSAPPPPQKDSAPPPKQSPPPPKEDASPPPASSPPPPSPPPPKETAPPPPKETTAPPPPKETAPPPTKTEKPQNPPPQESTPAPKTPAPTTPTPTPPASRDSPPAPAASESKVLPPPPPPQPLPSTPTKNVPTPSLGPPAPSSPNTGDSPSKGGVGTADTILIVGVTGAFVFFIVAALLCVICMRKKEKKHYYGDPPRGQPKGNNYGGYNQNWYGPASKEHGPPPPGYNKGGGWGPAPPQTPSSGEMSSNFSDPTNPASPNLAFGFNQSSFTYDELAAATDKFSQPNLLGQGGFGYVHKGVLPSGKVVAVKSLKSGSGQGEREFHAEVDIISRVHHRHLVSLVGYCIAGGQRMLVYEFVPNGNLEQHLHANYKGVTLDWSKRVTIGIGSAKGLAYLHEDCHPRIIHRDIKAANILIDNNYEAMVADFGLAKLTTDNLTHVSTRVMGTFGYMAPEYASSGKLTEKSDVYSFGVMLLELITGRRPVDTSNSDMDDSLVDWARPILTRALGDGNFDELVDPSLENNYNPNEMRRMIACASASIRHSAKRRPKMSQIVRALEGDVSLDDLNNDVTRANQSNSSSTLSSVYDTRAYNEDLKNFHKLALESQIQGDEYGVNPTSSSEEASSREMK